MRYERQARPLEDFPLPGELFFDIGVIMAVMLGLALLANVSLGAYLPR